MGDSYYQSYGNGSLGPQEGARNTQATGGPRPGQPGGPRHDAAYVEGKLFLGGLDLQSTRETVQAYCAQWGDISDIVVMEGRGFGFVTFADPAAATSFLQQKEHSIGKCHNRRVEAKAAVPRQQSEPSHGPGRGYSTPVVSNKVFVGGTGDLEDEQLRNYFLQYGEITDAAVGGYTIVRHPDGGTRGFGFVTFAQSQSAEACAGRTHDIEGRVVEVKQAVPRDAMAERGGDMRGRGGPERGRGGYGGSYGGGGGYGDRGGGYGGGYGGGPYGNRGGEHTLLRGSGPYGNLPVSEWFGGRGGYGPGGFGGMGGGGYGMGGNGMGGMGMGNMGPMAANGMYPMGMGMMGAMGGYGMGGGTGPSRGLAAGAGPAAGSFDNFPAVASPAAGYGMGGGLPGPGG
ncbi:hypothetical protein QJQ45_015952, partial [Haematococcus lacustris]